MVSTMPLYDPVPLSFTANPNQDPGSEFDTYVWVDGFTVRYWYDEDQGSWTVASSHRPQLSDAVPLDGPSFQQMYADVVNATGKPCMDSWNQNCTYVAFVTHPMFGSGTKEGRLIGAYMLTGDDVRPLNANDGFTVNYFHNEEFKQPWTPGGGVVAVRRSDLREVHAFLDGRREIYKTYLFGQSLANAWCYMAGESSKDQQVRNAFCYLMENHLRFRQVADRMNKRLRELSDDIYALYLCKRDGKKPERTQKHVVSRCMGVIRDAGPSFQSADQFFIEYICQLPYRRVRFILGLCGTRR